MSLITKNKRRMRLDVGFDVKKSNYFYYPIMFCGELRKIYLEHNRIEGKREFEIHYEVKTKKGSYLSHRYYCGDSLAEALLVFELEREFKCDIINLNDR